MVTEADLVLADGRTLHAYDTAPDDGVRLALFWQHGTPNVGAPPEPLMAAADRLGIRWVSYDRPGYGGSTPLPGRDIASAAGDVAAVADAFGIGTFAVMGHSGGGPHALACAALLPERVLAAVSVSGLAPTQAEGLDWYAGMAGSGAAELRAAVAGRAHLESLLSSAEWDPEIFTASDHAALGGDWAWLNTVVAAALEGGLGGMLDDDLAYVAPWGFEPGPFAAPVLLLHGEQDRCVPSAHSEWLARQSPSARLWLRPGDGHISALNSAVEAMEWLRVVLPR